MELLIILVVWLAIGWLTAHLASGKGRSAGGWFVLGVLFGPFAIVAILVMPNLAPQTSQRRGAR